MLSAVYPEVQWQTGRFLNQPARQTVKKGVPEGGTWQRHVTKYSSLSLPSSPPFSLDDTIWTAAYWKDVENQKAAVARVAKTLGIKEASEWYSVTARQFKQAGGRSLLELCYNNSLCHLLTTLYPTHEWHPWLFANIPDGTEYKRRRERKAVFSDSCHSSYFFLFALFWLENKNQVIGLTTITWLSLCDGLNRS